MLIKKGFTFLVLFLSISIFAKADVGCALNYANSSSEIIYFKLLGKISGLNNYGGSPTYNNVGFPTACPRYNYYTAIDDGKVCCVNGNCNGIKTRVNFTPIPCPIDDYLPLMLLAAGGVGVFFLRRRLIFS